MVYQQNTNLKQISNDNLELISQLFDYLNQNVDSSYPKSEYIMPTIVQKIQNSSFSNDSDFTDTFVLNNKTLVELLLSFIVNPTSEYYKIMKFKLSKLKYINHKDLFVDKKNGEMNLININENLSIHEMLKVLTLPHLKIDNNSFNLVNVNWIIKLKFILINLILHLNLLILQLWLKEI